MNFVIARMGTKKVILLKILEALTTPLLPIEAEKTRASPNISMVDVALSQLKILVTWTNRNTKEKHGNLGEDKTAIS